MTDETQPEDIDNCVNIATSHEQLSICPTAKQRNKINAVVHKTKQAKEEEITLDLLFS